MCLIQKLKVTCRVPQGSVLFCSFCILMTGNKLNNQIHEQYTRSNYNVNDGIIINNLFVPTAHTNYGLKQLKVSGTRIWNELPSYLKNAPSFIHISKKSESILYIKLQIIIPTICSCLYFHTIPFSQSIFFLIPIKVKIDYFFFFYHYYYSVKFFFK